MPHEKCTYVIPGLPDDLINSHVINERRLKVENQSIETALLIDGRNYLASGNFIMQPFEEMLFMIVPDDFIGISSIGVKTQLDDTVDFKQYKDPIDPVIDENLTRTNLNQESNNLPQTTVSKLSSVSDKGTLVAETIGFLTGGREISFFLKRPNLFVIKNIQAQTVRLNFSIVWYEQGAISTDGFDYTFDFQLS